MALREKIGTILISSFILISVLLVSTLYMINSFFKGGDEEHRIECDKINSSINIYENSYGFPFIKVQNTNDMFFGMGFYHAAKRAPKMYYYKKLSEGRLSEFLGDTFLEKDKFYRSLNLNYHAKMILDSLDSKSFQIINNYTNGVNSFFNHGFEQFLEFQAFPYDKKTWYPVDIIRLHLLYKIIDDKNLHRELIPSINSNKSLSEIIEPKLDFVGNELLPIYNELNSISRVTSNDSKIIYAIKQNSTMLSYASVSSLDLPSDKLFMNFLVNDSIITVLSYAGDIQPEFVKSENKFISFENINSLNWNLVKKTSDKEYETTKKITPVFVVDTIHSFNKNIKYYRAFINDNEVIYNGDNTSYSLFINGFDTINDDFYELYYNPNHISPNKMIFDSTSVIINSNTFNLSDKAFFNDEVNLNQEKRLEQLLNEGSLEILDLHLIENDIYSSFASNLLNQIDSLINPFKDKLNDLERARFQELNNWDKLLINMNDKNSMSNLFLNYVDILIDNYDDLDPELKEIINNDIELKEQLIFHLVRDINNENLKTKISWMLNSFRQAVANENKEIEMIKIDHFLEKYNSAFKPFSSSEFYQLGGPSTIRSFNKQNGKYFSRNTKFIFEFGSNNYQLYIHGGQSGNVNDDNYLDQFRIWLNGGYIKTVNNENPNDMKLKYEIIKQ